MLSHELAAVTVQLLVETERLGNETTIWYIYVYVRITLRERNLSKKRKHMAAPGPAILFHLELAVQSTKVP